MQWKWQDLDLNLIVPNGLYGTLVNLVCYCGLENRDLWD